VKHASVTDVGWRVVAWGHSPRQTGPRAHFLAPAPFLGCCSCAVERNEGSERWCAWCANTRACKWSTSCMWAHPSCRALDHVQNNQRQEVQGDAHTHALLAGSYVTPVPMLVAPLWTTCSVVMDHTALSGAGGRGQGVALSVCKREKIARSHTCDTRRQPQTVQSERVSPHLRQPGVAQQAHLHLARPRKPSICWAGGQKRATTTAPHGPHRGL
jgi:hypothetical protein